MAVTKRLVQVSLLLLFLESKSIAQTRVELDSNMLFQSGYGGKQVYDGSGNQQLSVYEPVLFIESTISSETKINARALLDVWSGASDHAFDTATGASGKRMSDSTQRNKEAFDLGVSTKLGEFGVTPNVGFSLSESYNSLHGGIGVQHGFAEDNFTVAVDYNHFQDGVSQQSPTTKRLSGSSPRNTDSTFLGTSQILSPSDIVFAGIGYTSQRGFLSTVGNTVAQGGTRVNEGLPNSRTKGILFVRGVHGFDDFVAAHLDYRFYTDDWGILAHSVEASIALEPDDDASVLRLFYRFHTQTGTKYYQDAFATTMAYMTSDSDLASLTSHEFGVQGTLSLGAFELGASVAYYFRSNDLKFFVAQASVAGTF